jgi:hypothetical protein
VEGELLNLQKSGQFPDEFVKIGDTQIHCVNSQTYECRYDERLKTKTEESTRLGYTGLVGELEHLQIKTRLIDEMLTSVMGEYVFLK